MNKSGAYIIANGDLTAVSVDSDNDDYQPSGSIIYRVVWVACGGQTNQALRMKDTSDTNMEVFLYKKDNGFAQYNNLSTGCQGDTDLGGAAAGIYINNQYYLNLSGSSDSGNEVIIWLLQVAE